MATQTYDPIASITLGANATTVTFSAIPQTYTDLHLTITTSTTGDMSIRFNGDSGNNYSATALFSYSSATGSGRQSNSASSWINYSSNSGNYLANINIMNYSNTTTNKTFIARDGTNGTGVDLICGLYRSTSAITSITLLPASSWLSGSIFNLFGIKAGNA